MAGAAGADMVYRGNGPGTGRTTNVGKLLVEARRDRVIAQALTGKSARAIAKVEGVSHVTISRDIKTRLKMWAATSPETARYRELHRQRIEALLEAWWPKAVNGSDLKNLDVLDRVTKLLERQSKLLGLDVDPTAPQGGEEGGTQVTVRYVLPKQVDPVAAARRVNEIDRVIDRVAGAEGATEALVKSGEKER